jgi:cytochrome c-type biogenesis protein CcmH
MKNWIKIFAALAFVLSASGSALAAEAKPLAENPALEARMMAIAVDLRCLVCQNQTVADSHAELAGDFRQQIRELLSAGKTDDQVRSYMTERYGDFVLYKPPFKATTALLWIGPVALMAMSMIGLIGLLRRRSKLPDSAFDPEEGESEEPKA